jgi:ABC-2 type transport system ATP-binding protein
LNPPEGSPGKTLDGVALLTRDLTRRFGDVVAVNGLDLAVPRGSIFGFLGPNGSGKTTTIRMALGLIRPDAGAVEIFGSDVRRDRKAALARVGALVEGPSLYGHLTGRENLEATRRLRGLDPARVDIVLERVGLTDSAGRRVAHYSLGMRQRLALGLALLPDPELLILDEPTNGLDPSGMREMRGALRSLAEDEGVTVFLSSHLLSEVDQTCTHVAILSRGRLIFQGVREELTERIETVLVVETTDPGAARRALEGLAAPIEAAGRGLRIGGIRDEAAAAAVNRALVEAGVPVHRLELRRPTLEEAFLQMTGEAE